MLIYMHKIISKSETPTMESGCILFEIFSMILNDITMYTAVLSVRNMKNYNNEISYCRTIVADRATLGKY